MLDSLKRVIEGGRLRSPSDRLEQLIETARSERDALTAVLNALAARGAEVAEVGELFARVDRKADESTRQLDGLAARLRELESRTAVLASIDGRIQLLADTAAQAKQTADRLLAPNGELQLHRAEIQRLSALTVETQTAAAALETERGAIEECRAQMARSSDLVTRTADEAQHLRIDVDGLRTITGALSAEYADLRQTARDAERGSVSALAAVERLEERLARVAETQRIGEAVDEKLAALHALAEHVFQKTMALEDQKQTLDRASLQANRLNEMVWNMDAQITRLDGAVREAARTRETLARVETLAAEAEQKLDIALKLRNEFALDTARFERDGRALVETVRASLERLALEKTQFDVLDRRLGAIQTSLEGAEVRMSLLASKEHHVGEVRQQIEDVAGELQILNAHARDLAERQAGLQTLADRLDHVDALAKQTSIRYDGLLQNRSEIDALRREILELRKSQGETAQLRERLAGDSAALEVIADRVASLRGQAPALELEIDTLLGKFAQVDTAARQAARLGEVADELDVRLARMAGRLEFVDGLEVRVNSLQRISGDVDRRLGEQFARRGELDAVRASLDGADARTKDLLVTLDALQTMGQRLLPLEDRVRSLSDDVAKAGVGLDEVRRQEKALAERRSSFETLLEQSRALAAETAERNRQMQSLTDVLERSIATKEEILSALSDLELRQRDALTRSASAEDHVARIEELIESLEARRGQLLSSEAQLSRIEARFLGLSRKSSEIDTAMQQLADREAVVLATRAEVDRIHQAGIKSRADFQYVSEQREDVAALRLKIDALLSAAADADDKIAAIQERHTTIDAVQAKATQVANLLEDVRVTLDSVGEQKAVVDHVAVKLARLDFITQEAQNTIRTLQHERELAQRIERQILQLRGRIGPGEGAGDAAQFVATARDE